ncbi:aspartate carbamoyltransferase regulatory subunit [Candidatus Woesearchaeota archaeon]|nr:aspartate carbamoyltransferase regulatory subunit [Candidatus Woesearchaeota archaeon]
MAENKGLMVQKIENGIVIDHIPKMASSRIVRMLHLHDRFEFYNGINCRSNKLGRKDFIKIVKGDLSNEELNKIAMVAPGATVMRIKGFEIVEKIPITISDEIKNLVKCPNTGCITNQEPYKKTHFIKLSDKPLKIKCRFCERTFKEGEFEFL